jgi:hypothetical protein
MYLPLIISYIHVENKRCLMGYLSGPLACSSDFCHSINSSYIHTKDHVTFFDHLSHLIISKSLPDLEKNLAWESLLKLNDIKLVLVL